MDGSRCVGLRWCTFVVALGRASHEPQVVVRRPISLIKGPGHLWRQRAPRFEPWELSLFCWPKVLQRMFSAGATTIYQLTGYILMVSMLGAKIYHEITTSNQLTFEVFSSKRITFGVCPIIIILGCAGLWGRPPARVELIDMAGKVLGALARLTWSSAHSVWWVLVLQLATVQAVGTTLPFGRSAGVASGLTEGLRTLSRMGGSGHVGRCTSSRSKGGYAPAAALCYFREFQPSPLDVCTRARSGTGRCSAV